MNRRTFIGAVGAIALGGGYLGYELFAPEQETQGNEEPSGGTVLKSGPFAGKANHECSGTVELVEDADGLFLQFREYQQTQGPDVFCYLTPAEDPDTSEEIDAGTKILIDGGADGGEITMVGTFSQRLPNRLTIADLNGVGIWCENFSVPFGAATLSRV